jgi:hypothetical protein
MGAGLSSGRTEQNPVPLLGDGDIASLRNVAYFFYANLNTLILSTKNVLEECNGELQPWSTCLMDNNGMVTTWLWNCLVRGTRDYRTAGEDGKPTVSGFWRWYQMHTVLVAALTDSASGDWIWQALQPGAVRRYQHVYNWRNKREKVTAQTTD